MNATLFAPDEMGDDSYRQQLRRLPDYDRVWLDWMLERGYVIEFLGDTWAFDCRVTAAISSGLRAFDPPPQRKTSFGKRPMKISHELIWGRHVRPTDRFDVKRINPDCVWVANEKKKEQQLFSKVPDTKPGWRLLEPAEIDLIIAIARCRFAPATFEKKFANDIAGRVAGDAHPMVSEKQWAIVQRMEHRYRIQLAALRRPDGNSKTA